MTYMSHYDRPFEPAGVLVHVSRSRSRPRVITETDSVPRSGERPVSTLRFRFIFRSRRFSSIFALVIIVLVVVFILIIAVGLGFIRHNNRVKICDLFQMLAIACLAGHQSPVTRQATMECTLCCPNTTTSDHTRKIMLASFFDWTASQQIHARQ